MKKLTLLLMPVMPGFEAWAVNGFIERPENPDNPEPKPMPLAPGSLKEVTHGFTTEAGDSVFVRYDRLCRTIRDVAKASSEVTIRPFDRGGILVSGVLTEEGWESLAQVVVPAIGDTLATKSK